MIATWPPCCQTQSIMQEHRTHIWKSTLKQQHSFVSRMTFAACCVMVAPLFLVWSLTTALSAQWLQRLFDERIHGRRRGRNTSLFHIRRHRRPLPDTSSTPLCVCDQSEPRKASYLAVKTLFQSLWRTWGNKLSVASMLTSSKLIKWQHWLIRRATDWCSKKTVSERNFSVSSTFHYAL